MYIHTLFDLIIEISPYFLYPVALYFICLLSFTIAENIYFQGSKWLLWGLESVGYSKLILQLQTDEESYNIVDLFKTMLLLFYEQSNRVDTQFPEQFELNLLVLRLDYYLWFKTFWF